MEKCQDLNSDVPDLSRHKCLHFCTWTESAVMSTLASFYQSNGPHILQADWFSLSMGPLQERAVYSTVYKSCGVFYHNNDSSYSL